MQLGRYLVNDLKDVWMTFHSVLRRMLTFGTNWCMSKAVKLHPQLSAPTPTTICILSIPSNCTCTSAQTWIGGEPAAWYYICVYTVLQQPTATFCVRLLSATSRIPSLCILQSPLLTTSYLGTVPSILSSSCRLPSAPYWSKGRPQDWKLQVSRWLHIGEFTALSVQGSVTNVTSCQLDYPFVS